MAAPTVTAPVAFNLDVNPPVLAPEFEVTEGSNSYEVKADMQGGENVRLGITNDRVVHIVADKKAEPSVEAQQGAQEVVQRAVPLPESVDETKVTASFKEGELHMNLPKKTEDTTAQAAVPAH